MLPRKKLARKESLEEVWICTIATEPDFHRLSQPPTFKTTYKPSKNGSLPRKTRKRNAKKSPPQKANDDENPYNLFIVVDETSEIHCPGKKVSYNISIEKITHDADVPTPTPEKTAEKEVGGECPDIGEDEGYIVTDEDLWKEHTFEDMLSYEEWCATMWTDEEMEQLHSK